MMMRKPEEPEVYLPEIQRRRLRRRRKIIAGAVFICVYFLGVGLLWFILWSPVLRVKNFELLGSGGVSREDLFNLLRWQVMDRQWKHFLGFDNILVWPESLPPEKLKYLPALKSLKIHKDYREGLLRITILERSPFGIWCFVKPEVPECFWFDEEGVILSRAPLAEGSLIPAVNDYSRGGLGVGAKILAENQIPNLFSIFRVLAAARLGIKEIRLEDIALWEVRVSTYEGPELYFSLRFPADGAFAVLQSLRSPSGTAAFDKLDYIDFRSENRAYYR
jgi:cell division septal protein FtsQ